MIKILLKLMKYSIYLIIIFFMVNIFAETSDIKIHIDDLDKDTLCPKPGTQHANDMHIVYLIDTTMELSEAQFDTIDRLLLSPEGLKDIKPYTRISIINLNGIDKQASQTDYLFSKCRPRNGEGPSELDKANWLTESSRLMKQMWKNKFIPSYENAKKDLRDQPEGDFTQLIEIIYELSRMPHLAFRDNYSERKLVIVSDLIQHSPNGGLSFVNSCVREKKCQSWEDIKSGDYGTLMRAMLPRFGENPPTVQLLYLNSNTDPNLNSGAFELWDAYFKDAGITNLMLDFETNR